MGEGGTERGKERERTGGHKLYANDYKFNIHTHTWPIHQQPGKSKVGPFKGGGPSNRETGHPLQLQMARSSDLATLH